MKSDALPFAIALLSRREHGAFELIRKLEAKGYSSVEAHDALKACQRLGYQSDARFAETISRVRIEQGYGPLRIREELAALQLDSELVQSVLERNREFWVERAMAVRAKKYKTSDDLTFKTLQKQKQFLYHRGFSTEIISQVFKYEKF